jgi:hypothetical protein
MIERIPRAHAIMSCAAPTRIECPERSSTVCGGRPALVATVFIIRPTVNGWRVEVRQQSVDKFGIACSQRFAKQETSDNLDLIF